MLCIGDTHHATRCKYPFKNNLYSLEAVYNHVTMQNVSDQIKAIREEFEEISWALDERRIRLWCAARASAYNRKHGRGGVMVVHEATGISRPTMYAGIKELDSQNRLATPSVRRRGGGRKKPLKPLQDLCLR